jgi:isopentenyl phosphate kinase
MTSEKRVVLIKLGGSLITNKSKPFTLHREALTNVVAQIKQALSKGNKRLIVGHGQGSFAHVPAEKYRTMEGKINDESVYGAAVVEDVACQMNRLVIGEMLKQSIPAVTQHPASSLVLNGKGVEDAFLRGVISLLGGGFVPVVFGDVLFTSEGNFTIWSTERVLNYVALQLKASGQQIDKVIHCGETDGFLKDGKVVEVITPNTYGEMRQALTKARGFDVTGGMEHKVEMALELAKEGIDSYIVGNNHGGNLYRAIMGEEFVGTRITA